MVQTIKSVLLFDYDSIHRSLSERAPGVEDLLGARAGLWLEAIESGQIVQATHVDAGTRRRFQVKRCYADPKLLGKNRGWLTANGVQVVDCTPSVGLDHGAANIHMTLDALDASESEPDEIIILSADTDLTPLLFRLKALNQRVVILVSEATAVSYKTFADGVIDEANLIELLAQPSERASAAEDGSIPRPPRMSAAKAAPRPAPSPANGAGRPEPRTEKAGARAELRTEKAEASPARHSLDRETLAVLVRRIHQATNVPLFSPRAFTELFRILAQDVGENGYKFPSTTENVTTKMVKLGRNVTKRQIGFVIKGLALRGHVFGSDDTPEQLAAAFYEQVLYLVENAKLDLSEVERGLVQAWIVGLRPEAGAPPPRRDEPRVLRSRAEAAEPREEPPAAQRFRVRPEPRPAPAPRRPAEGAEAPTGREQRARPEPMRAAPRPRRVVDEPPQRPAASGESDLARRVARNGGTMPPRVRTQPPPDLDAKREAELEDSILSAIADAVDVLADDSVPEPAERRPASRGRAPIAPEVDQPLDDLGGDDETDEIGDEIQRILASYNEGR